MPVVATNRYSSMISQAGLTVAPTAWKGVTPSDTDQLSEVCKVLLVLTAGNVAVVDVEGNPTTFTGVPAGFYLIGFFKQVKATGTTGSMNIYAGS